jgi:DNA-binding PadR family transcriptional regulator
MTARYFEFPAPPPGWGRMWATSDDDAEERPRKGRGRGKGRGHGHHGGPRDRGDVGFGPGFGGAPGFGPGFGPEFGRGFGPGFGPGPGRRRAARGNVRNAVLALLAEEPLHGYAVIGLLAERSGGLWRPSPGSVYPVLGQLEVEGLVSADESSGRKVFALTDAGRGYVEEHAAELSEPWSEAQSRHRDRALSLFHALRGVGAAAHEVARHGDDAAVEAARATLDQTRRALYRILAGEPGDGSADDGAAAEPSDQSEQAEQSRQAEPTDGGTA